jgi:hypothetical protein
MSSMLATNSVELSVPADDVLRSVLRQIAVPMKVLEEARTRRNLVLELAMKHDAARARFNSGSIAHGTENSPLGDADCGIKVDRRFEVFRSFGPDSLEGNGPEAFIVMFSEFILPKLQAKYPRAEVNLEGNRAIKFEFNEPVEIDDWGPVDPFVELIVGLDRSNGPGIWIPNRREAGWDAADPEYHTYLMTERDVRRLRVHRAQILRLAKRAIKRDGVVEGRVQVMCSWNLSALALELVEEVGPITASLAAFFTGAASEIAGGLTEDPAEAVEGPIRLPDGVSNQIAATRLKEMADVAYAALGANSRGGARAHFEALFGPEIEAIRASEESRLRGAYRTRSSAALASVLGVPGVQKITRSHGA